MAKIRTNGRNAARIWAEKLGDVELTTYGSLTFDGLVAWSYAEPVAVLDPETNTAYVTRGRFSITTSGHTGTVGAACAIAGLDIQDRSHGRIRKLAREQGQGWKLGYRGQGYERSYERNVGVAA
jgi:hypothetical protein